MALIRIKNNVNRVVDNDYWNEECAHLQPVDGQSMIEGDHIILPAEEWDLHGESVYFMGGRNLAFDRSISILGGPTTFLAHKQDHAQPAYAVYSYEDKTAVIQFN